jgi:hypothetical protein
MVFVTIEPLYNWGSKYVRSPSNTWQLKFWSPSIANYIVNQSTIKKIWLLIVQSLVGDQKISIAFRFEEW